MTLEGLMLMEIKSDSSFPAGQGGRRREEGGGGSCCIGALKKKRRNCAELTTRRLRKKFAQKMLRKARRKLTYEKAKPCQMYRTEIRMARMARRAANFSVPAEPTLASVIRIRGIDGASPRVRKGLQLVHLRRIFTGTFVQARPCELQDAQRGISKRDFAD
ncbi:hypothetical protein QTO34_012434 [Cnephaeus nilssonii]|uniref:Large ribosomal subunit protein uL30-like ferredoxin-like fold domain-containing protein n=1 Tax=Cnephaeus nilssonii TaxID=3371016 RepID=A0AA40HB30_CNENI|nr:hypothetical protein QTO34_012434 [Eptesicus nilssonii]